MSAALFAAVYSLALYSLSLLAAGSAVINYLSGFTSTMGLSLNGGAVLNGTRLRLTDGATNEARSAFFTTQSTCNRSPTIAASRSPTPLGEGITFTIQGYTLTAIGPAGDVLGYGPPSPGYLPGFP